MSATASKVKDIFSGRSIYDESLLYEYMNNLIKGQLKYGTESTDEEEEEEEEKEQMKAK